MKDDFNFEQTLGLLAQSFENKKYADAIAHIKKLASHPEQNDAVPVILGALDHLEKNVGSWDVLSQLTTFIGTLKNPQGEAEQNLQRQLIQKWTEILDRLTASHPNQALQLLTWTTRGMEMDNPVKILSIFAWEKLVESSSVSDEYIRERALEINNEIKNPDFRLAVLKKIATHRSEKPDETLAKLMSVIDTTGLAHFQKEDPASAKLFIQIMADILQERESGYELKKKRDIGWKILVWGAPIDVASAKIGARYYLEGTKAHYEPLDPNVAFSCYHDVVQRFQKNPSFSAEVEKARSLILDLAEAGKINDDWYGHHGAGEHFLEEINRKNDTAEGLSDRETNILFVRVCEDMPKGVDLFDSAYSHAIFLLKMLQADDPRRAEIITLCKDGLALHYAEKDAKAYTGMLGSLLNVAAVKGDEAIVRFIETEWKAGVEKMAAQNARQAYESVLDAIKYDEEKSALRALAESILPDLEKRAGIQSKPQAVNSTEFLQRFGGGKKGPTL